MDNGFNQACPHGNTLIDGYKDKDSLPPEDEEEEPEEPKDLMQLFEEGAYFEFAKRVAYPLMYMRGEI